MSAITLLSLMFGLTGLLLIALALPLVARRIAPNWMYGFRTRKTMSSPAIWYAANHASGRAMALAGAATVLWAIGVVAFGQALPETVALALLFGGLIVPIMAALVYSFGVLKNLPA